MIWCTEEDFNFHLWADSHQGHRRQVCAIFLSRGMKITSQCQCLGKTLSVTDVNCGGPVDFLRGSRWRGWKKAPLHCPAKFMCQDLWSPEEFPTEDRQHNTLHTWHFLHVPAQTKELQNHRHWLSNFQFLQSSNFSQSCNRNKSGSKSSLKKFWMGSWSITVGDNGVIKYNTVVNQGV